MKKTVLLIGLLVTASALMAQVSAAGKTYCYQYQCTVDNENGGQYREPLKSENIYITFDNFSCHFSDENGKIKSIYTYFDDVYGLWENVFYFLGAYNPYIFLVRNIDGIVGAPMKVYRTGYLSFSSDYGRLYYSCWSAQSPGDGSEYMRKLRIYERIEQDKQEPPKTEIPKTDGPVAE